MGKLQNRTVVWGNIQLDDYENQWTDTLTIVHCWDTSVSEYEDEEPDYGFLDVFIGNECLNLGEPTFVDSDQDILELITRENIEEWLKLIFWQGAEIKAFKLEKLNYDKGYKGERGE